MKITDRGRQCVKDSGSGRSEALREVVREVRPYLALVERVVYRDEESISATDVAAHWYEHFRSDVADSEKVLNDQAVCFFQIAQGADLGTLIIGRKGMPTRFSFDDEALRLFLDTLNVGMDSDLPTDDSIEGNEQLAIVDDGHIDGAAGEADDIVAGGNRVFITHGKNRKIVDQVKEIVTYGKFQPVVAIEHETPAKPVPQKVIADMKSCKAAVIHVSAERELLDEEGNDFLQINENVLIEIGAAMALYGNKFVLLVEEGVELPSNLQGLYECRYEGDELNMPATMKLLRAFSEF